MVVDRVLADPAAIPLIGVPGAKERAYAPACVIAAEHAIAAVVETGRARADAPAVTSADANQAMIDTPTRQGRDPAHRRPTSSGRRDRHLRSRRRPGPGRRGRREDHRAGRGAGRVRRRRLHRGRHRHLRPGRPHPRHRRRHRRRRRWRRCCGASTTNQTRLNANTVVILDEAGMTDDPDLLRLLTAADDAGAKVVMVGDDRQLGAVGPGGSLGALDRPARAWRVGPRPERPPARPGRAGRARRAARRRPRGRRRTGWPPTVASPPAPTAPRRSARWSTAWLADVEAGKDTVMLAWRRTNVDALNRLARTAVRPNGAGCRAPRSKRPAAAATGPVTASSPSPPAPTARSSPPNAAPSPR